MVLSSELAPQNFVCACEEYYRQSCSSQGFYKEAGGKRYCIFHYPGQDKIEEFRVALTERLSEAETCEFTGVWFPVGIDFEQLVQVPAMFNGAHFAGHVRFEGNFNEDVWFGGTVFAGGANFDKAQFRQAVVFFNSQFKGTTTFSSSRFFEDAIFNGVNFEYVSFQQATFLMDVSFLNSKFRGFADFSESEFLREANFENARFEGQAYFQFSKFHGHMSFKNAFFQDQANFRWARFVKAVSQGASIVQDFEDIVPKGDAVQVSFEGARFKDSLTFGRNVFSEGAAVTLAAAIFENPDRVIFHTVRLRPHWFLNIDPRKFNFIQADWGFLDQATAVNSEIAAIENHQIGYSSPLLEVTFRQLAVNSEENNRYEEAANFRYMAMEIKRKNRWRKIDLLRLSWWYWLLSGYGERVQRAFCALVSIWLLFGLFYWLGNPTWWEPKPNDKVIVASNDKERPLAPVISNPLTLPDSLIYSASVMALQKPQPLPANKKAKILVLLETILGPVQGALLVLAIRRKFIR